jgi:hypothetical protein
MTDEGDARRIALTFPSVTQRPSYGLPGFRVQDRLFARIHEEPGVLVLWRTSVVDRDELISAAPDRFFTTPHYAGHPTVLLRLASVDTTELHELLTDAWQVRASKRLRERYVGNWSASGPA